MSTSDAVVPESRVRSEVYAAVAEFARPQARTAIGQIVNTLLPYLGLWAAMVLTVRAGLPYAVTLGLAILAAGFHVRVFILFHDCCHGSFFGDARANRLLGYVTGILTFTPFEQWRRSHAEHHASVGDLDRRGAGDVWTMTVSEYQAASRLRRLAYRVFRNPLIMFGLGPVIVFVFGHRFSKKGAAPAERRSVVRTNLALLALLVLVHFTIGLRTYLLIITPILLVAGAAGVWLFYVQHQFEGVYWERHAAWDPLAAALRGSSYYKLPKALQWITGNIGLHHIHHVQSRIPNYNLQAVQDRVAAFQAVRPLTLRSSLHCLRLRLWDEAAQRLVGFPGRGSGSTAAAS
jgi:omega-6 fatty acid desaturase (delta-12 desaturase)